MGKAKQKIWPALAPSSPVFDHCFLAKPTKLLYSSGPYMAKPSSTTQFLTIVTFRHQ